MRLVYMAHPVSSPGVEHNLMQARYWVRSIYDARPDVAVLAHWIVDCEVLDDSNEEHRHLGFAHDFAIIERCDEVWLVGKRVSGGMLREAEHARTLGIPVRQIETIADIPRREP